MADPTHSMETQIALLNRHMKDMADSLVRIEQSQRDLAQSHSTLSVQTGQAMFEFNMRLKKLEDQAKADAPILLEIARLKERVTGARVFSRWVWITVGGIGVAVIKGRESIFKFLSGA